MPQKQKKPQPRKKPRPQRSSGTRRKPRKSKLYDFLRELSDNPEKLALFERDAKKAMKASKLTVEEQNLVRSGDEECIMVYLGSEIEIRPRRRLRIRIPPLRIRVIEP
jgi:hypothetical protein